jgi:hypothetical protein
LKKKIRAGFDMSDRTIPLSVSPHSKELKTILLFFSLLASFENWKCVHEITMLLSPSQETASCAATRELSIILWNPKVYYHVHTSRPLFPLLSQMNPIHAVRLPSSLIHSFVTLEEILARLPSLAQSCTMTAMERFIIFYGFLPVIFITWHPGAACV